MLARTKGILLILLLGAGALLRAVAAGDSATFARVYAWTGSNLSRRERQGDALLARRWGPRPDGARGVLEDNTDAALGGS